MTQREPPQRYQGEAGRAYHEGKRAIPEQAFPWVAQSRARKFQTWIRAGDTVFEYGVGYGWNLAALSCVRKVGFDVSAFLKPDVERRGIEFIDSPSALPESFADVVICHHTLEHVPNPIEVLCELRRLVRRTVLVAVPYEHERRYRRFDPAEPNHHLYSWNAQTLGNLLTDSGLTADFIAVQRYGYDRFAAALAAKFGGGSALFKMIRAGAVALKPLLEVHAAARKSASP